MVMIVQSVLPILQHNPIMMICADRLRAFIKRVLDLTFLEKFYCDGGRSQNVFELCKECPFKKCCIEHGIDACSKCSEYPCKDISDYQEKYVNKYNQPENK